MLFDTAAIANEYRSVDDVIAALVEIQTIFRNNRDRRAIFVTAYVLITQEIKRRIEANLFADGAWVARYAVSFANLYRLALAYYESSQLNLVPKAWLQSFETSKQGSGLLLQDLFL